MTSKAVSLTELILKESRTIALEILERKLDAAGLPLPKESNLETHLDALISAMPEILKTAEARVKSRKDAYSESLAKIGIEVEPFEILDISLDLKQ